MKKILLLVILILTSKDLALAEMSNNPERMAVADQGTLVPQLKEEMLKALKSLYISQLAALKIYEMGLEVNPPLTIKHDENNKMFFEKAVRNYEEIHNQSLHMNISEETILQTEIEGINTAENWNSLIELKNSNKDSYAAYLLASKALLDIRYSHLENGVSAIKQANKLKERLAK